MDNNQTPQEVSNTEILDLVKELVSSIKEKNFLNSIKIFFKILAESYKKYIKGHYLNINNKQVPYVAILAVIIAIFAISLSVPTAEETPENENQLKEQKEDVNTYEGNNIKVYGIYKCENAVCGFIENTNEIDIARILISITFHDKSGAVVYEGGAEANGVTAMSRMKFKIPVDGKFDYFRLNDVTIEKE